MEATLQDIRHSYEQMPFFQFIGFEIVKFEEEDVIIKLDIHNNLLNVNETLHGGIHAAMIDQVLSMTVRTKSKTRCATINLSLNYLAPVESGTIYAKGRMLQIGYKIATVEAIVYTEEGNILAKGTGTFKLIRD
nr:PaaI family thioesterase [Lysinibacillus timonensis]